MLILKGFRAFFISEIFLLEFNYFHQMKLLADSGSTKTDWCCLENGQKTFFKTQGINPFWMNESQIQQIIQQELLPQISQHFSSPSSLERAGVRLSEVYFYGAGCVGDKINVIKNVLQTLFSANKIEIHSDLLAAARAAAANEKGLILILGTGSNSGLYDGEKFIQQIPSLGFLLGDEGSGSWLGKRVVADYFRKNLPEKIYESVDKMISEKSFTEFNTLLKQQTLQGKYLAQFASVLKEHHSSEYAKRIVTKGFESLFENVIVHYDSFEKYPLYAVGSVAFYFADELKSVAKKYNCIVEKIIQSPIEDLIKFHE